MNILLTGGSGFIGKNLQEGLQNKYRIFAPTHRELDIVDSKAVRKYIIKNKIRIVIHTAVEGGDRVLENILKMFLSIYNNLDLLDKFINFGSGAQYGKTRDLKKVKETELGKFIPEDNYGLGKLICSQLARSNKKIVTLIPFGIFGKYEDYRFKFVSNSIIKNLLGMPIRIKQNVTFDYLFIDDLIPVIDFFVKNKKYWGDFNVTPTRSINLIEIAGIINSFSQYKSKINIENQKLNYQYTGNNSKIRNTVPYLKITSHKDAIKTMLAFYLKNISRINKKDIIKDNYFIRAKIKNEKN